MSDPAGIVIRTLRVPRPLRSLVHWVLEAHEGLATLTEPPEADGALVLTVPVERARELDGLLADLAQEFPVFLTP